MIVKKIIVSFLLMVLSAPVFSKEVTTVYQIVIDNSIGSLNVEEKKKYTEAFLDRAFRQVKSTSKAKVYIISTLEGKNLWIGSGRDFKKKKAGLLDVFKELDHGTGKTSLYGQVIGDMDAVFSRIQSNEDDHYYTMKKSVISIFSPLLDTTHLLKAGQSSFIDEVVKVNRKTMPPILNSFVSSKTAVKKRHMEVFFIDDSIFSTIQNSIGSNPFAHIGLYSRTESKTILFDHLRK